MIVDLAAYDGPTEVPCDVCIAGAGAAGLTIALQFIGRPERVVVLEGGGLDYSEASQAIYRGEIVGREYFPLDATRLRYLGGTTNHWGGYCRPLQPLDFAARPWVPHSGWPIGEEDLRPHRERAHEILDIGAPRYDPGAIELPEGASLMGLDPDLLVHDLWRFSPPTRFGEKYRRTLAEAGNVTVLLNASVTDIALSDNLRRAEALRVLGPGGERALRVVGARAFVLALGGLETPRLLLNANRQLPAGIGNQHDLVGRFFMEHLDVFQAGGIVAADLGRFDGYRRIDPPNGGGRIMPSLSLSAGVRAREGLLVNNITFDVVTEREVSPGWRALRRLAADAAGRGDFSDFAEGVWEVMTDLGGVSRGLYGKLTGRPGIARVTVHARAEQAPNPDSRVQLTDEVDRLGLRRLALDWRLTPLEKRTVRATSRLLGRELGRLGLGRVRLPEWLEDDAGGDRGDDWGEWGVTLAGGHHHMGTTRMADDPKRGVVDRDCRVHGLDNLYVAGSSVFATGGFATPTLTIVELALRLAEHLKAASAA